MHLAKSRGQKIVKNTWPGFFNKLILKGEEGETIPEYKDNNGAQCAGQLQRDIFAFLCKAIKELLSMLIISNGNWQQASQRHTEVSAGEMTGINLSPQKTN